MTPCKLLCIARKNFPNFRTAGLEFLSNAAAAWRILNTPLTPISCSAKSTTSRAALGDSDASEWNEAEP